MDGWTKYLRPRYMEYPRHWICDTTFSTAEEKAEQYKHDGEWCEACLMYEDWMRELGSNTLITPQQFDKLWKKANTDWNKNCPMRAKPASHKGNGTHQGLYAGTLTMAPEWGKTEDDIVHAIEKIMAQKTCPVSKYAWYLEYTKNGTPHIHFIYETESKGRIHKKIFKRYWEWGEGEEGKQMGQGWEGGYHKPVKSEVAYQEYISKDEGRHAIKGFAPE